MSNTGKSDYRLIIEKLVIAGINKDPEFNRLVDRFLVRLEQEQLEAIKLGIAAFETRIGSKVDDMMRHMKLHLGNSIDYSLLPESLREILLLDNTHMIKCRHGLHSVAGAPDFEQYCVYAHYQNEGLINIYFINNYEKKSNIKSFIDSKTLAENYSLHHSEKVKKVSFASKLYKINEINELVNYNVVRNINSVRNNFLHRGGETAHEDQVVNDFKSTGLGKIKRRDMTPEQTQLNDLYYTIMFKRKANYQAVDTALEEFYKRVAANI